MCQQTKGEADIRSLPNIVTGTTVAPRCLRGVFPNAPYTWLLKVVRHWSTTNSKTHMSNLEHLIKQYPDYVTKTMEEIHPYIKPPWWSLTNTMTHIANIPKDKAKEEHENFLRNNSTPNILYIYTNRSGI